MTLPGPRDAEGREGAVVPEGKVYPRVLIASAMPPAVEQNTGLTLASLFADWPHGQCRHLYADEVRQDGPDGNGGWHVSLRSVYGYGLLRPVVQAYRQSRGGMGGIKLPPGIGSGKTGGWTPRHAVAVARAWADILPYEVSPAMWRWLRDFAPEVICSPLGSIRWTVLVNQIARGVHAPIAPFFFDDWPAALYHFSRWVRAPRSVLHRRLAAVLVRSPVLLCISDRMGREYERRYGIHAESFMRCVPTARDRPAPRPGASPLRLLYTGGLHLKRWEVLDRLGDALTRLRAEGVQVSLSIYAPARDVAEWKERLDRPGIVEVVGSLAASDMAATLEGADVLVHVESFDEEVARYTRLSLSTKLPEYLASGRPLLVIGPAGLSSVEYIRECGAGLVVDEHGADAVVSAVRRLATEPELRATLAEAGWRTARARHDGDSERERFRALLDAVAQGEVGEVVDAY